MKSIFLFLSLVAFSVMAQERTPPVGIKPIVVNMQLFCADSFEFLMNVLAEDFKEYPIMMGYLKEGAQEAHSLVYFTNKEMTQSTLVVSKVSKNKEEACIIWSGTSPSGMSFSVNPNPMFADEL